MQVNLLGVGDHSWGPVPNSLLHAHGGQQAWAGERDPSYKQNGDCWHFSTAGDLLRAQAPERGTKSDRAFCNSAASGVGKLQKVTMTQERNKCVVSNPAQVFVSW